MLQQRKVQGYLQLKWSPACTYSMEQTTLHHKKNGNFCRQLEDKSIVEVVKLCHILKFTKDQNDSFIESLSLKYLCSVLRSSCVFAQAFHSDEVFVSQLPRWTVSSVCLITTPLLMVLHDFPPDPLQWIKFTSLSSSRHGAAIK